jgi:uncharacterized membrane protein YkvA (DUF1232 family)
MVSHTTWSAAVAIAAGLLSIWIMLVVAVWRLRPDDLTLGESLRLLPDLLRLLKRLAADREVPRGARVRLWLLLVYLASPIDLIPDFLPVIGYADDAIIVVLALRSAVRRAGVPAVREHWPGSPQGLQAVLRIARLSTGATQEDRPGRAEDLD